MPFVKVDCDIRTSSLWPDKSARDIFITALLMARPVETKAPLRQIRVTSNDYMDFSAPPGWYGFVPAAASAIIKEAIVSKKSGIAALERLGESDRESRTPDNDGRRMIRVDGGYLILNYELYRQKDYTAAARAKRYRDRKSSESESRRDDSTSRVTAPNVTQAEAYTEAEPKGELPFDALPSTTAPEREVELPPGFPKTLPEAIQAASLDDYDPKWIDLEWDRAVSRGGVDRSGNPIRSWRRYLKVCANGKAERERGKKNGAMKPEDWK